MTSGGDIMYCGRSLCPVMMLAVKSLSLGQWHFNMGRTGEKRGEIDSLFGE